MGILGGLGKVIGLDDIFGEVGDTVRQILPNKEAERQFDLEMAKLKDKVNQRVHEEMLAQVGVNKIEAAHQSLFVAGWRPFIGWVCGGGIAWNFVVSPFLSIFGVDLAVLQIEYLISLCITMLGAQGVRSYEKVKGVSTDGPLRLNPKMPEPMLELTEELDPTTEEENAPWNR